jgi:hypothetical protein
MKLKCVYINIFGKRQVMIARMQYALPNEWNNWTKHTRTIDLKKCFL